MSLTKIGSIGINTGIQFAGVTTVSTLHVGSGVTLSSDGDVFFTGIITGNGSGLTNLTGIDLVNDTTPQLGGNLDVNTKNITFGDSGSASDDRLTFGAGTDLSMYHDGSDSYISHNGTGNFYVQTSEASVEDLYLQAGNDIYLRPQTGDNGIKVIGDGAVELYYDNSKKLETTTIGVTLSGDLKLPDNEEVRLGDGNDLQLYHNGSQSYVTNNTGNLNLTSAGAVVTKVNTNEDAIVCNANGSVDLYYDNSVRISTLTEGAKVKRTSGGSTSLFIEGAEGGSAILEMFADDGDDNADKFRLTTVSDGNFYIQNYANGGWQSNIQIAGSGAITLRHENEIQLVTSGNGIDLRDQQNSPTLGFFGADGTDEVARITGDAVSGTTGQLIFSVLIGNTTTHVANFDTSGHFNPYTDNTYDLGTSSKRWRNLYTTDLQLSNEGKSNSVDGTWGNYTIQEGESDLFLINNRSGKKYKFNLTEVS